MGFIVSKLSAFGHISAFIILYVAPAVFWAVLWVVCTSTAQAFPGEALIERRGFQFTILQNALFLAAVIYFPITAGHAIFEHLEHTKHLNKDLNLHGPLRFLECIRIVSVSLALSCMCVRVWLLFFAIKLNAVLEDREWMQIIDYSWKSAATKKKKKKKHTAEDTRDDKVQTKMQTSEALAVVVIVDTNTSAGAEELVRLPSLHDDVSLSADMVKLPTPQVAVSGMDKTSAMQVANASSPTTDEDNTANDDNGPVPILETDTDSPNLESFWLDYEHSLGSAQWLVPRVAVLFTLLSALLVFLWVDGRHLGQEYLMNGWILATALLPLAAWYSYNRVRDVLDIWRELRVIVVASLCFNVADNVFDALTLAGKLTWPLFYSVSFVWLTCAMLTSLPSLLWPLYLLEKRTHNRFAHRFSSVAQLGRGLTASPRGDSENHPSLFSSWPKPYLPTLSHSQKQIAKKEKEKEHSGDSGSLEEENEADDTDVRENTPSSLGARSESILAMKESPSSATTVSLQSPSVAASTTQSQTKEPKALATAMAFSEGALNPQNVDSTPRINDTTFPSPFLRWVFEAFDSVFRLFGAFQRETVNAWDNMLEATRVKKTDGSSSTQSFQSSLSLHSKAVMHAAREKGLRPILADINGVGIFMQFLMSEVSGENLLASIEFYQFAIVFGSDDNVDGGGGDLQDGDADDAKSDDESVPPRVRRMRSAFGARAKFPEPRKGVFPFSSIVHKSDATITSAFLALANKYIVPESKYEVNVPYKMRRKVLRLRSKVRAELRSGNQLSEELIQAMAHAFDAVSAELYVLLKHSFDRWSDTLQFLVFAKALRR